MRPHFGNSSDLDDMIKQYAKEKESLDDMGLLIFIWARFGLDLDEEQQLILKGQCPTPETIFRCKRKLREKGEL